MTTAPEEGRSSWPCPECDKSFTEERYLKSHVAQKHGAGASKAQSSREKKAGARPPMSEAWFAEQQVKLTKNLQFDGGLLMAFLPHTGLTVATRAHISAKVLIGFARDNEQIAQLVDGFNRFHEGSEGAKVLMDIGAGVAVDMGVNPDVTLHLGPMEVAPIMALIPDVVAEVARLREEAEAAAESNGHYPPPEQPVDVSGERVEVVPGGVEAT